MTIRQGNGDSSFAHFNLAADFHVVAAAQFNKVAHVGFQMKADEVGIEKPAQHLIAPRKLPVDFRRWEGDMQEEPDCEIRAQLPQYSRNQLQLIILHPHGRTRCCDRCNFGGKTQVDVAISVPPGAVELRGNNQIVV